jgi:hypothetical protein
MLSCHATVQTVAPTLLGHVRFPSVIVQEQLSCPAILKVTGFSACWRNLQVSVSNTFTSRITEQAVDHAWLPEPMIILYQHSEDSHGQL